MKKIVIAILFAAFFSSCDDFLEREQFDKVSSQGFFKTENDLLLYSNGFLDQLMPGYEELAYGDRTCDNISSDRLEPFLSGGWTADQQGGWSITQWSYLRNINYFLDNMKTAKAEDKIMKHYEGVGRFWRAWFYFDMVRTFGDVPYYDHEVPSDNQEDLYKNRDSREFVMSKVLEDLTFAAENCLAESKYVASSNLINKWVVLAFKSRVCLFEGTYRKYHPELSLTGSAQAFLTEAANAAADLMNGGAYSLIHTASKVQTQYRSLFTSENIQTKEVILGVSYAAGLKEHFVTKNYYNLTAVGDHWGISKDFVNTYLMLDGSRFTEKPGYETVLFKDEFTNRDYRLKQTIRHPGYKRTVSNVNNVAVAPSPQSSATCYQFIKWSLDNDYYDSYAGTYDLPFIRYAEVLLNYAEAKAEMGQFNETEWNKTIKLLRERAGVNGTPPASFDPYLANYYMNQTTDKWILEIRRERGIELIMENRRYDDLMRWKLGEMLLKSWTGIYVPAVNTLMDLDNDGSPDFYASSKTVPDKDKVKGVVYITPGEGSYTGLSEGTKGYVKVRNERVWNDKFYLKPIPRSAIVINSNLSQNPGWE